MEKFALKRESILNKIPTQLDPRQAFLIDGIRISFEIIEEELVLLEHKLSIFSTEDARPRISSLFTSVWNIIDSSARLKRMLESIGIFSIEPAMKNLFDEIFLVRHTFQHLDERIDELFIDKGNPILGQLSWTYSVSAEEIKMFMVKSGIDHKHNPQRISLNLLSNYRIGINELALTAFKRVGKKVFATTEIQFDSLIQNLNMLVEAIEARLENNNVLFSATAGFSNTRHWVGLVNQLNCSKASNGGPHINQSITYDDFGLINFEQT
ncbi:hypothetical protein [Hymenobacter psychrotolerans]|uniref:Uncharacterized protein n=1 Tax=Hymenobacter psychrotolerans DSM 18569 TaxID=1121959 RepID=A0A1M7CG54_9BACT|nr:hypothetical protein [Hymenobacter psychrotolerans]SHL66146.1 hypothetical protein SAMN02746009_03151 [Hymenobacter psychrotolerans DSM 18569]